MGPAVPRQPAPEGLGLGVLLVEEEPQIRSLLAGWLERIGCATVVAGDASEALRLYRDRHEEIDVALVDLGAAGADGSQTLAALRGVNPSLPCCFMAGGASGFSDEALLSLGNTGILKKPFSFTQVGEALRRLVVSARRGKS